MNNWKKEKKNNPSQMAKMNQWTKVEKNSILYNQILSRILIFLQKVSKISFSKDFYIKPGTSQGEAATIEALELRFIARRG